MPSRNILKIDAPDSYYHIYARGINKSKIFLDDQDYTLFISLFKRYLSTEQKFNSNGVPYAHLSNSVELLCYCIMSNHFHMLIYQEQAGGMSKLMRGIMTSYSRYYNTKYHRRGPLFESRYKASLVYNQSYLEHITRYIHLNPEKWRKYPYSSLAYYLNQKNAVWINPSKITSMFGNDHEYTKFLEDYEDNKRALELIKHDLANDIVT